MVGGTTDTCRWHEKELANQFDKIQKSYPNFYAGTLPNEEPDSTYEYDCFMIRDKKSLKGAAWQEQIKAEFGKHLQHQTFRPQSDSEVNDYKRRGHRLIPMSGIGK